MGTSRRCSWTFSLPLLLSLVQASAQYASLMTSSFSTIGETTYARLVFDVAPCYRLHPSPMSPQRTGNRVGQTIYARNDDICICDVFFPCPNHTEVVTSPLGMFTPGDYTLDLELSDWLNGSQEQFIPFTVPQHDDKTLTASRETNSVRLDVNGIADCFYAIESSSTLTNNWAELTN